MRILSGLFFLSLINYCCVSVSLKSMKSRNFCIIVLETSSGINHTLLGVTRNIVCSALFM